MRIAVCAKFDLLGAIALNSLLPKLRGDEVQLFYSTKTRSKENAVPELDFMKLMERDIPQELAFGLADHAVDTLDAPVTAAGRAPLATHARLARWTGRPPVFLNDVRVHGEGRQLAAFAPDLIISVRFSLIFKPDMIDRVPLGIVNVHPGPLPGYRGLFAPFWQILHGEQQLGCTVHVIDPGIDTGDVIGIARVPFQADRSLIWHAAQLYPAGLGLLDPVLAAARRGQAPAGSRQDDAVSRYFRMPGSEEFAAFREAGHQMVTSRDYIELLGAFVPGTGVRERKVAP